MRKEQLTLTTESFSGEKYMKLSIYADANSVQEMTAKALRLMHKELSDKMDLGTFEEFVESLKTQEDTFGRCDLNYKDVRNIKRVD